MLDTDVLLLVLVLLLGSFWAGEGTISSAASSDPLYCRPQTHCTAGWGRSKGGELDSFVEHLRYIHLMRPELNKTSDVCTVLARNPVILMVGTGGQPDETQPGRGAETPRRA